MSPNDFIDLVATVTRRVGDLPLNEDLRALLDREFPVDGEAFTAIRAACAEGAAAGWLCNREQGGIKFGRIAQATPALNGFSIDVVDMDEVVGPHHRHPLGEIDMIMPIDEAARFDGEGAGWVVYPPGSAHKPTVSGGRAYVLYLLPGGQIEFTRG